MRIEKFLILAFIFTLPYNNFPYGVGGTLTPLSLIPLTFFVLVRFIKFMVKGNLKIKKVLFVMTIIFFTFILLTILNDIYFWEYFTNAKITSPIFRTFQFVIYSFITLGSFWIGYKSLYYFKSIDKVLQLILLAFLPSLIFGTLEILFNNSNILNIIRSFIANTKFPDGYYRIYLLTTEPSWASFDIATFIIPISIYLYSKNKNKLYLFITLISLVLFVFTKSLLGLVVFSLSIFFFTLIFYKTFFKKKKYLILYMFLVFFITISFFLLNDIYLERLNNFLHGSDSSGLTRIASYLVAIETFKSYPLFGVGFRNTGYLYPNIISYKYPDLLNIYLIEDWVDFYSNRFPDIKSTILEILSSSGVIGISILLLVGIKLTIYIKKIPEKRIKMLFTFILLAALLGSFSINLIGYSIFWFFIGFFLNKKYYIYKGLK